MPATSRRGPASHQCVVVGAGLLGLATARSLSRRGVEVVVLDRAAPGHALAGSKGKTRIFRLGYPDPLYAQMAAMALPLWHALEEETGLTLLTPTGQLTFGAEIEHIAQAVLDAGGAPVALTQTERAAQFPAFHLSGPALFEPDSGVLAADNCLRALEISGGFELQADSGVRAIDDHRDEVVLTLDSGQRMTAEVVVNCAGHHAVELQPGRVPSARPATLQQVAYFACADELPIFIEWGADMIYGLPVPGRPLYKLAQHRPGPTLESEDAPPADDPDHVATLVAAARRILPCLDPTPVATERCIYDNTVDHDFVLDRVGRVVIGCGTSGHGFKFGPLLGEILAELAVGTEPAFDLSRFASSRSFLRAVPDP